MIPEDDANRQLANGFKDHPAVAQRNLDIRPVAEGWVHVLKVFEDEYVSFMRRHSAVHVVLLLDFDVKGESRRELCEKHIPDDLKPRTFLIGTSDTPEGFKKNMNLTLEKLGFELAAGCDREDLGLWTHPHLAHNLDEVKRMRQTIHGILFAKG